MISQTSALETKLWQFPVVAETERFNNCATTSSDYTWLDTVCIQIRVKTVMAGFLYTQNDGGGILFVENKQKKEDLTL